jgi:hypothetical protein
MIMAIGLAILLSFLALSRIFFSRRMSRAKRRETDRAHFSEGRRIP